MNSQHQIKEENQDDEVVNEVAIEEKTEDPVNFNRKQSTAFTNEELAEHQHKRQCMICCYRVHTDLLMPFCCQQHKYCKSCIISIIKTRLSDFKIIKCPQDQCSVEFNEKSPFYIEMPESDHLKLHKIIRNRDVLVNPQVKICRKQECDGFLTISNKQVHCQQCKQKYCHKCLEMDHQGRCENQIAKLLERKHRYRKCPNCKMIVQKVNGCSHMTCSCTYQFCYLCSAQFTPSHICQRPQASNCLATMHLQLQREDSTYNKCIHCGKILDFLTPNPQYSTTCKYIYILLFSLTIYPLFISAMITVALGFCFFWALIFIMAISLYLTIYPLLEVIQLELPPSIFLLQHNVPPLIVRILSVPLYPVNLVFLILRQIRKFPACSSNMLPLSHFLPFFVSLPCLMLLNTVRDNQ